MSSQVGLQSADWFCQLVHFTNFSTVTDNVATWETVFDSGVKVWDMSYKLEMNLKYHLGTSSTNSC